MAGGGKGRGAPMERFAIGQATSRLNRLAFELRRAAKSGDPGAVHDLRVSIRRFVQCLRVFGQFFPAKEAKRMRRRLGEVMDLAAGVRNRDIAIGLLIEAGLDQGSSLIASQEEERRRALRELASVLRRWNRREFSAKWRARLKL